MLEKKKERFDFYFELVNMKSIYIVDKDNVNGKLFNHPFVAIFGYLFI